MLRNLLCFLFFLVGVLSFSFAQTRIGVMEFDSTAVSLGEFPRDSSVRHCVFTFRNTGEKKLAFYGASPDCPCVKVSFPKEAVGPEEIGQIEVTYDGSKKRAGSMRHRIYFSVSGPPANFCVQIYGVMTEK